MVFFKATVLASRYSFADWHLCWDVFVTDSVPFPSQRTRKDIDTHYSCALLFSGLFQCKKSAEAHWWQLYHLVAVLLSQSPQQAVVSPCEFATVSSCPTRSVLFPHGYRNAAHRSDAHSQPAHRFSGWKSPCAQRGQIWYHSTAGEGGRDSIDTASTFVWENP